MRYIRRLTKQLETWIKLKIDALLAFMRSLCSGITKGGPGGSVLKIYKNEKHYWDEASLFLIQHYQDFRLVELDFENIRHAHIDRKLNMLGATVMFYFDESGRPVYKLLSELGEYEFEYVREHALDNDHYGVLAIMHRYENLYAYVLESMSQG